MPRGYRMGLLLLGDSPSVPDGSTVTPINDVPTWLRCAGIPTTTYTTLSEVLADTSLLRVLINSENAMDYLVRSTDWTGIIGLVPVMTSNTAPSGMCFGSTKNSNSKDYYYVFSGATPSSDTDAFICVPDSPYYIGYKFVSSKVINKITAKNRTNTSSPLALTNFIVEGSNDGTNYTTIASLTNTNTSSGGEWSLSFNNSVAYEYIRVYSSTRFAISALQFYSEGICDGSTAMSLIGLNNYASDTLLADETWLNAICNSTYFESVLNVKVPIMTSNNTPEGLCIGDATNGTYNYQAFDGNDTSRTYVTNQIGKTIGYQFISSCKVKKVFFKPYWNGDTYNVEGSNDGDTWDNIGSIIGNMSGSTAVVNATTNYTYYRFNQSTKISSNNLQEYLTVQFYGRQDV